MTSMKAPPTRLEQRIIRSYTHLKRARFDGDEVYIDIAESDLNRLLDQWPRPNSPRENE